MKLNKIKQIYNVGSLLYGCDVLICGCGYENRCVWLMDEYKDQINSIGLKYVLSYDSPNCEQITENRQKFIDEKFKVQIITCDDTLSHFFCKIVDNLNKMPQKEIRIVIDYSSMERQWYAKFLTFFNELNIDGIKKISCMFHYTVAKYCSSTDKHLAIEHIHPLEGFSAVSLPDRPTALIAGLGGEPKILVGLKSYLNVDLIHYYYSNKYFEPPMDEVYKIEFNRIESQYLHEYDFNKVIAIFNSLYDLYQHLNEKYRLLVVSCGPKPFTLVSLIFASIYHIDVWRLKTNIDKHLVERTPSGDSVNIECEYVNMNETINIL